MIQSDSQYVLIHRLLYQLRKQPQTHRYSQQSPLESGLQLILTMRKTDADEFAEPDKNRASPLPDFPDTQHRASGRIRKKSRLLDGYIA
ncbi:hypothetical protein N7471_013471 [Penicillium samsonianum]|uniref:uncharacterized protein n=1 Tax=Penicillium samsonianum TaxID=1882272 RepID=UPI0025477B25|nr:uncharacterized protein N7471_013471 [Penicillium samsonianum]KAJ6118851.1 hypothetical protein N7471_013471 [Penicillium samsonianum]